MSAKRSRQKDKIATHRAIATQLAESIAEVETSSDEEQELLIKETQLEDDRRETILSGFDPDSTPLQKFSFVEDFNTAVLTIGYLFPSELSAVEAVRRQLPAEHDPWWDIDYDDYYPSPRDLSDLRAMDGSTPTHFVDDMEHI